MSKNTYRRNMKADWPNYNTNQGKTRKQTETDSRNLFLAYVVFTLICIGLLIASYLKQ